MKKGCRQTFLGALIIIPALVIGMIGQDIYTQQFQAPVCYDYARQKALPDLEYLEFSDVVIATGQFHGHVCQFTDRRTGFPVELQFDVADVPYRLDTLHVLSMVALAGCGWALAWGIVSWLARRIGL